MFTDKTVVITGGTGFIGKNITSALLAKGANVVVLSRSVPVGNNSNSRVRHISCNLQETTLHKILTSHNISPEYIIHLAAMAGGIHYLMQNQAVCLQTNLSIISNTFYKINEFKSLRGQILLSSVCAYPKGLQTTTDKYNVILAENCESFYDPDSSYGWSKIMGEKLIRHYSEDFGVPGVSIRLFNTYGPHEHFDDTRTHVLPAMIGKALKYPLHGPFTVLGDGSQVRSFLYIDDAVTAIEAALLTVQDGSIINVGSDEPHTIRELVDKIVKLSKKQIPVEYGSTSVGAKGRLPDLTKARDILRWRPTITLDEGLNKMYNWAETEYISGRL